MNDLSFEEIRYAILEGIVLEGEWEALMHTEET